MLGQMTTIPWRWTCPWAPRPRLTPRWGSVGLRALSRSLASPPGGPWRSAWPPASASSPRWRPEPWWSGCRRCCQPGSCTGGAESRSGNASRSLQSGPGLLGDHCRKWRKMRKLLRIIRTSKKMEIPDRHFHNSKAWEFDVSKRMFVDRQILRL